MCAHGLSYTPSSNTPSCTMCEHALPWHVAPEPCLGPSAGHLEGGPSAAAGLTGSPAALITRLSSSKECPLPPGDPLQGSTWSTHWLELLSPASPCSKPCGTSQISLVCAHVFPRLDQCSSLQATLPASVPLTVIFLSSKPFRVTPGLITFHGSLFPTGTKSRFPHEIGKALPG